MVSNYTTYEFHNGLHLLFAKVKVLIADRDLCENQEPGSAPSIGSCEKSAVLLFTFSHFTNKPRPSQWITYLAMEC